MKYIDAAENEWELSNSNHIIGNLRKISFGDEANDFMRIDQIGPYRFSFLTHDSTMYRIKYDLIFILAKKIKETLNCDVFLGGSHSPLSAKAPNEYSDIDIYLVPDRFNKLDELRKQCQNIIGQFNWNKDISIGIIHKNWLNLHCFSEAVNILKESYLWSWTEVQCEEEYFRRIAAAHQYMLNLTLKDVASEINEIYGADLDLAKIKKVIVSPRWKSIDHCTGKRKFEILNTE